MQDIERTKNDDEDNLRDKIDELNQENAEKIKLKNKIHEEEIEKINKGHAKNMTDTEAEIKRQNDGHKNNMIKQKEEIENKVAERKKDSATKMAKDEANTKEYIADWRKRNKNK